MNGSQIRQVVYGSLAVVGAMGTYTFNLQHRGNRRSASATVTSRSINALRSGSLRQDDAEASSPLGPEVVARQPLGNRCQPLGAQVVVPLAALLLRDHQTGPAQHRQVLRHRRLRHGEVRADLGDRERPVLGQAEHRASDRLATAVNASAVRGGRVMASMYR